MEAPMTDAAKLSRQPYVTTYKSIGGWKAVMVWWNPDGFWEPWQTGIGAYAAENEAAAEAQSMAVSEGILYRPRQEVTRG